MLLLHLFYSFALIGLGAYGGGMVTIPLMQHEIVTMRQWLSFQEMSEIIALAQMTPGPIAINAATFTGYRVAGVLGSLVATGAVVFPSIVIISCIIVIFSLIGKNGFMLELKKSVGPGVFSMIFLAIFTFGQNAIGSLTALGIALCAFAIFVLSKSRIHPIVVIICSGIVGVFLF